MMFVMWVARGHGAWKHGAYSTCPMPIYYVVSMDIISDIMHIWRERLSLTGLRTLGLSLRLLSWRAIPRSAIATHEAGDSLGVDILAIDAESRLFALGGALLLLAKHQMDFLCLDIFANMPCGEAIFVLLFSDGIWVRRCAIRSLQGERERENERKKDSSTMRRTYNLFP